ncbi:MAG: hypothetical protein DRJ99_01030 [Thermoplasmata archaeon]|nr:MAG: hypothetical protein DRJ99_01030 [Thermoplasmata archaeon]
MHRRNVVFIAMLMISTSFLPIINSQIIKTERIRKNPQHDIQTVDFVLRQYTSKGVTEIKKKIPLSLAWEISSKLKRAENIREKLSLLKKYGLISKIPSLEEMRVEANKVAEKYNLLNEKVIDRIKSLNTMARIKICISRMVSVEGMSVVGFFPVGLSAITGFINGILFLIELMHDLPFMLIPSADLLVYMVTGESSSPKLADGHMDVDIGLLTPGLRYYEGGPGSWFLAIGFIGLAFYWGIPPGFSSLEADMMGYVPIGIAYLTPW